jgi:hypothetical protein
MTLKSLFSKNAVLSMSHYSILVSSSEVSKVATQYLIERKEKSIRILYPREKDLTSWELLFTRLTTKTTFLLQ